MKNKILFRLLCTILAVSMMAVTPVGTTVYAADVYAINEDFSSYVLQPDGLGGYVPKEITAANSSWKVSNPSIFYAFGDPDDPYNQLGDLRTANPVGGASSVIYRTVQSAAKAGDSYIISGRIKQIGRRGDGFDPSFSLAIRGSSGGANPYYTGTNYPIATFHNAADGRILVFGNTAACGYTVSDEWLSFTISIKLQGNFTACPATITLGGGISTNAYNPSNPTAVRNRTIVRQTKNLDISGMTNLTTQPMFLVVQSYKHTSAPAGQESIYIDHLSVLSATSLDISAPTATAVELIGPTRIQFAHDFDSTTIDKARVHVTGPSGPVAIDSVTFDPAKPDYIDINFAQTLEYSTAYTVSLDNTITDIGGNHCQNTTSFSTRSAPGSVDKINSIQLNTPSNLSQTVGSLSQVDFTATTTPSFNVDPSTVTWYVNNVLQPETGLRFSFMPTTAGTYVISTAVSDNPAAITASRTIEAVKPSMPASTMYLDEDFDDYHINDTVSTVVWQYNSLNKVISEPGNSENQVLSLYPPASGSAYPSLRKNIPLIEPVMLSGRVQLPTATSGLAVGFRDPVSDIVKQMIRFTNGNIQVLNGLAAGKFIAGEWINYEIALVPNLEAPDQTYMWARLTGGIADASGTPVSEYENGRIVSFEDMQFDSNLFRLDGTIPAGTGNGVLLDDLKITDAPPLEVSLPVNKNIPLGGPVNISFSHAVNPATLSANKVTVTDAETGAPVAVSGISLAPNGKSAIVSFGETLAADTEYAVLLSQAVNSMIGGTPRTMPFFTTGASDPPETAFIPVYVTKINVTVPELILPQNFPLSCQLTARVFPSNAANKAFVWVSDNPAVAAVDADGNVTLLSEGVANITAEALDGNSTVSNPCTITVTPAVDRSGNNKLNLGPTTTPRYDLEKALSWPAQIGEGIVANWEDNKTGAYCFSQDDGGSGEYNIWLDWSKQYDFPVTFFIPTAKQTTLDGLTPLVEANQDIQSHTKYHYDPESRKNVVTSEVIYDYQEPIYAIERVTGTKPITMAYAWLGGGDGYVEYGQEFFAAGRYGGAPANSPTMCDYNRTTHFSLSNQVNVFEKKGGVSYADKLSMEGSVMTLIDPTVKQGGESGYGGWTAILCHGITSTATNADLGANTSLVDIINYTFDHYITPNRNKIWLTGYSQIIRYGQERDTASLTITENAANGIKYTLTDEMDDTVFDYPLTVKFKVDPTWTGITATQSGNTLPLSVTEENGGKYVLVKTVPDRGEVTLAPASNTISLNTTAETFAENTTNGLIRVTINNANQDFTVVSSDASVVDWINGKMAVGRAGIATLTFTAAADGSTAIFTATVVPNTDVVGVLAVHGTASYDGASRTITLTSDADSDYMSFKTVPNTSATVELVGINDPDVCIVNGTHVMLLNTSPAQKTFQLRLTYGGESELYNVVAHMTGSAGMADSLKTVRVQAGYAIDTAGRTVTLAAEPGPPKKDAQGNILIAQTTQTSVAFTTNLGMNTVWGDTMEWSATDQPSVFQWSGRPYVLLNTKNGYLTVKNPIVENASFNIKIDGVLYAVSVDFGNYSEIMSITTQRVPATDAGKVTSPQNGPTIAWNSSSYSVAFTTNLGAGAEWACTEIADLRLVDSGSIDIKGDIVWKPRPDARAYYNHQNGYITIVNPAWNGSVSGTYTDVYNFTATYNGVESNLQVTVNWAPMP